MISLTAFQARAAAYRQEDLLYQEENVERESGNSQDTRSNSPQIKPVGAIALIPHLTSDPVDPCRLFRVGRVRR